MSNDRKSLLGYGLDFRMKPEKIMVVDTNVILSDPVNAIAKLQGDRHNAVVVPLVVIGEIDGLKHTKPMLNSSIAAAVKDMNQRQHGQDPYFYIAQGDIRKYNELDQRNPDHHIIATYLCLHEQYPDIPIMLISNDGPMHTFALALGIDIQEYEANRADTSVFEHALPHYSTDEFDIGHDGKFYIPDEFGYGNGWVPENGGAVLSSGATSFACIKKGRFLCPIRSDISALGIYPHTLLENETNWEMYLAFEQLLDLSIDFVSLTGIAGTGKTLMAIACALKLVEKKKYDRILITRPIVFMGDRKDILGALPGGLEEKIFPWLQPIYDNLTFLESLSAANEKLSKDLRAKNRLEILPFNQARGRSVSKAIIILDEGQNATHEDLITIGSRAGNGTKVIVTGDVEQIDIYPRDKRVNALSHAVIDLMDEPICATTNLVQPARSVLASLIATKLRRS